MRRLFVGGPHDGMWEDVRNDYDSVVVPVYPPAGLYGYTLEDDVPTRVVYHPLKLKMFGAYALVMIDSRLDERGRNQALGDALFSDLGKEVFS